MAKEVKKEAEQLAAAEAKPAEKKEKKSQKERPRSKKKHANVQVWKLYELKDGKAVRKRESCPRCGPGTFLAAFKARKYCGKCGYGIVGQAEVKAK